MVISKQRLVFLAVLFCFSSACTFVVCEQTVSAQQATSRLQPTHINTATKAPTFPDEYSDFDDKTQKGVTSPISQKLEKARQKYLRALTSIEKQDTIGATTQFESAIELLHGLVSYPNIEQNEDFTDLAQSIIEDYESYIQNIDNLSENSSAFILREKLFAEVDAYSRDSRPEVTTIKTYPSLKFPVTSSLPSLTIPLVNNESVEKSLAFLTQERGRKFFKHWLERGTKWFPMMRRIAKEEGMPEEIMYLSMIESALNPNAVSRAKAVGLWQFTQAAATDYNLNVNFWVDERRDPEKSTRAAMRYLRSLYNEFGDWHLALAAYNCGPNGSIRRALAKAKSEHATFWDIRENLPRETRSYVPLYIATTLITLNPENYGFSQEELNFEPEYQYETISITEPVSIKSLAKCADLSIQELRMLNTELVSICTPPTAGAYSLKLPIGKKDVFSTSFAMLADDEKRPWTMHEVKKGETLSSIATQYGVPSQEIASLNQITGYKTKLKRGTTLRVPMESTNNAAPVLIASTIQSKAESVESATQSEQVTVQNNGQSSNALQSGNIAEKQFEHSQDKQLERSTEKSNDKTLDSEAIQVDRSKTITHTTRAGESLYSISQRYGVRLTDLRNWNNISIGNDIVQLGSKLIIAPDKEISTTLSSQKTTEKNINNQYAKSLTHKIVRGETLAQIADDYNVTVETLKKTNRIKRTSSIVAGQILTIPAISSSSSSYSASQSSEKKNTRLAASSVKYHKVKKGENLGEIAALYGVKDDELRSWNPTLKKDRIIAGEQLKVFGSQISKGSAEAQSREISHLPKHYKVRSGDSLAEIAEKFGVSIATLRTKNKLGNKSDIRAGQTLRIQ
ncbi:MAG: LysM peptidoglycan-binding domain-containing protein [Ignavibacteria bacterium]|nr:LysM peptidoglycan-binding domain-containing protein [Ignavibacteria bacterium]